MSDYKNLDVWNLSHKLVLDIYELTHAFPKSELYGLKSQMRRAAYSVPTNIAEGYGRLHRKELIQFLNIAKGSANELEYELLLAKDLSYISVEEYEEVNVRVNTVMKMLTGLIRSINR
ncbi:MAG: four helix bundle protein [Clostridia bacterium]|nr:four helix bundle protein [Clostridia bacterium]